jgi:ferredoxin-NADP reductase
MTGRRCNAALRVGDADARHEADEDPGGRDPTRDHHGVLADVEHDRGRDAETIRQQVAAADSHIDYVKWVSETQGQITAKGILEKTGALEDYAVLLCGPPAMMRALEDQFLAMGLPRHRIIFEDFAFR